jgi:hypothetical protein
VGGGHALMRSQKLKEKKTMKKQYLRSTRNLYYKDEDGIRIFYSYSTPVAFLRDDGKFIISENKWGISNDQDQNKSGNDPLKTAAMVSKLFGLLSTNDEKAIKQKKRYFEIAGCTFPEDWDQLSLEEKQSRISKAENFGIKY